MASVTHTGGKSKTLYLNDLFLGLSVDKWACAEQAVLGPATEQLVSVTPVMGRIFGFSGVFKKNKKIWSQVNGDINSAFPEGVFAVVSHLLSEIVVAEVNILLSFFFFFGDFF